jgi:outer membrane protein TolC
MKREDAARAWQALLPSATLRASYTRNQYPASSIVPADRLETDHSTTSTSCSVPSEKTANAVKSIGSAPMATLASNWKSRLNDL